MKAFVHTAASVALMLLSSAALLGQETPVNRRDPQPQIRYPLGIDSLPNDQASKGNLEGPHLFQSKVMADTIRKYWGYVPAQYTPDEPACVLVFQDGARAINPNGVLRVPQVLENLIAKKQIPVTIGIFITPGQRGDEFPESIGTGNPNNRDRDWYLQNQKMVAALKEKGYDMAHVFGKGGHSDDHGGSMLPQMLRWIWRDYPGIQPPTSDLVAEAAAIEQNVDELFPGYDQDAEVDPSGTYTWERRFGNTMSTSTLIILSKDGTVSGQYSVKRDDADPTSTEIINPIMDGNKIVFDVTLPFGNREFSFTLAGVVSAQGINGWQMMNFGGQNRDSQWSAARERPYGFLKATNHVSSWQFENTDNGKGEMKVEEDAIVFDTNQVGQENWHVQAYQSGLKLVDGATYQLKFSAKSPSASTILVVAMINEADWHTIGLQEEIFLGENFQEYTYTFSADDVANDNRIGFVLGESKGTVVVKDMSLIER